MVSITVISTILGIVLLGFKKDEFESSINAQSNYLDYPTIQSAVSFVDNNLKLKNYKTLAEFLSISEDQIKNFKSVSVSHIKRKVINTSSKTTSFNVIFTVFDTKQFENCEEILVKSFENNELIYSRIQSQKNRIELIINEIKQSIVQIDSIYLRVNEFMSGNSDSKRGNILTSPDDLSTNKIVLINSLYAHEEDLENTIAISIVNQTNDYKPLKNKWIYPLAFFFIGIILSLIYVFGLEVFKGIREL